MHGPSGTICPRQGCNNLVVQGGVCVTHGAKRKHCSFLGCIKTVKLKGFCSTHPGPPGPPAGPPGPHLGKIMINYGGNGGSGANCQLVNNDGEGGGVQNNNKRDSNNIFLSLLHKAVSDPETDPASIGFPAALAL